MTDSNQPERANTEIWIEQQYGDINFLRPQRRQRLWPAVAGVVLVAVYLVLLPRDREEHSSASASPSTTTTTKDPGTGTTTGTGTTVPMSTPDVAVALPAPSTAATSVPPRYEPAGPPPAKPACGASLTPLYSGDNLGCKTTAMPHAEAIALWPGGGRTMMVVGEGNRLCSSPTTSDPSSG